MLNIEKNIMSIKGNIEKNKAVFVDIDGVLCEKAKLGEYIDSIEKFKWKEGAKESILLLNKNKFMVFVVTNKACINKGITPKEQVWGMYNHVFDGLPIENILLCPHRPDENCECRKPKEGLILKGMKFHHIDPRDCWVIGDNDVDIVAGERAGCKTILIENDGFRELEMHPTFKVKDIEEAVNIIISLMYNK